VELRNEVGLVLVLCSNVKQLKKVGCRVSAINFPFLHNLRLMLLLILCNPT
jgi:hypothetical protein